MELANEVAMHSAQCECSTSFDLLDLVIWVQLPSRQKFQQRKDEVPVQTLGQRRRQVILSHDDKSLLF